MYGFHTLCFFLHSSCSRLILFLTFISSLLLTHYRKVTGQHCRYKLSIILGNKFDVIPAAVENTKICQILVEVHGSATDNVRLLQIASLSSAF